MNIKIQLPVLTTGIWVLLLLLFGMQTGQAQNIVKIEYYLDVDPGVGQGTNVPITAGVDITQSFIVNINTLSNGFHKLFVRSLVRPYEVTESYQLAGQTITKTYKKGGWSLATVRTFYKESFTTTNNTLVNVTKGEYYINTDPGFGNGTNIPITAGKDLTNVGFAMNVSALANGFHNVYVRFRDANGKWSLSSVRTFYKEDVPVGTGTLPNIVKGEYFLDTDPGFGNGTNLSFTAGTDLNNITFMANISAMEPGFHKLYVRFKDANGKWSLGSHKTFFKESFSSSDQVPNIVKAEYFINDDPGFGKGKSINVTPGTNLSNLTFALDMAAVSVGNHKLYVRAMDNKGKWSITSVSSFKVEPSSELIVTVGTITGSPFCAGASLNIPFTVNAPFGSNNIFTAQLSNATGNFTNPVNIGTASVNSSGSIPANIPANTVQGTGYRIRIVASSPQDTSAVNNTDLIINRVPAFAGNISGDTYVCINTQAKNYSVNPVTGVDYTWDLSGGGSILANNETASINWTTPGTYILTLTPSNDCGNGQASTRQVVVFGNEPTKTPIATRNGNSLFASAISIADGVTGYQWYKDGKAIQNATGSAYSANENGLYTVRFTNPCGEGPESNSILVGTKIGQTITFEEVADKTFGDSFIILKAVSTSKLAVSFELTSGPGSLKTDTLTITGAGAITVRARQEGDDTYNAADPVTQQIIVNKAQATIQLSNLTQTYTGTAKLPTVITTPAGLPVTFTFNNAPQAINAGTYSVVATINNANYQGSTTGTFIVEKASQEITLEAISDKTISDLPFIINATATSRLPVTFAIKTEPSSGVASLKENTITLLGQAGKVTVTVTQPGNSNYNSATPVEQVFAVLAASTYPDLAVQTVTANKTTVAPEEVVTVTWKVANVSEASSPVNWTERIYVQSVNGANRTMLKQAVFTSNDVLQAEEILSRSDTVVIPSQLNIGDQGVFVVELIPDASINEIPGGEANNTGVQQTSWAILKLLSLELSAIQLTEGTSEVITATVNRTGSLANPLSVNIQLDQPERFSFPASVTLPAGQAGSTFIITAPDNTILEGTVTDTIRISAANFRLAKARITLLDNDMPSLSITNLPKDAIEGKSVSFKVNTNLKLSSPLQVFLTSGSRARFPIPPSVTIAAGALSADVTVSLEQDNLPEMDIEVAITATASSHNQANDTIIVKDDDLPNLELIVQTNIISESAGLYATKATLRRKTGGNPIDFTANISTELANTLILPATISLQAGENEKTFDIGVVDNNSAEGDRLVTISASVFVNSCGCNVSSGSSGSVSAAITITDNDGPALQLTATPLTLPEGAVNAGLLRITRNTATNTSLRVNLSSSDTSEATIFATAVIPAGQAFVEVPITTKNDGVSDGSQQVYFQAIADGFSTGLVWVLVSDQNKPDLQIASVSLNDTLVQTMTLFNYQVSVINTGFATAPTGVLVRGYLSKDEVWDESDTLITEDLTSVSIPAGTTVQVKNAVQAPNKPGKYKLIFRVNPEYSLTELLLTNNTSTPANFTINPGYTATASVSADYYLKGTPIPIAGSAVKINGTPAVSEKVEVYVITNGLRRTVMATTDASGNYTTQFVPLSKESGSYIVGASFPGIGANEEQDNFDILGVRINEDKIPQFKVIVGDTLNGALAIENLSNTSLTNFSLQPVILPNGATIRFDTIADFKGNSTFNLSYSVIGTTISPGTNFEVSTLQAFSEEGTIQKVDVFYFCQAPQAFLLADITKINVTASQSKGERQIEIKLINKGIGATGRVSINLPQVKWLSSVTPKNLPSMETGDTTTVILKFLALAEVPFNFPINGSIGVNTQNGNSFNIPFTFEKVSQSNGIVQVTVTNQFTYYSEDAPKVKDAFVQIKNYFSGEIYAEGSTNAEGIYTASNIPEGKHRIIVTKEKHLDYNSTITINPGDTTKTSVFINYQAITFSWKVVPTAVEDQYDITLEALFETHVPIPVVTIEMPKTMPLLSGSETYAFNVTLTNHGLITAKDVALNLPKNDPVYEFVTNYVPADLLAQQSIQVPVIMRRRNSQINAFSPSGVVTIGEVSRLLGMNESQYSAMASQSLPCQSYTTVLYWYTCNLSTGLWQTNAFEFDFGGRYCPGGPGGSSDIPRGPGGGLGGGGGVPNCAWCPVFGDGDGNTPLYETEKKSCVDCINDIIDAAKGCAPGSGDEKGVSTNPVDLVIGSFEFGYCIGTAIAQDGDLSDYLDCVPVPLPPGVECAKGIIDAIKTCLDSGFGEEGVAGFEKAIQAFASKQNQNLKSQSVGSVFGQIADNMQTAVNAYQIREQWSKEYFGNMIYLDGFDDFVSLVESYVVRLDSIQPEDQTIILQQLEGYELSQLEMKTFFTRWNTSVYARATGIKEPTNQYPSIVNWNQVKAFSDSLIVATNKAKALGYISVGDMFQQTFTDLNVIIDAQQQAVCATVKVQIKQRLTMTREAFEGTLDIFNGHPTDKMDSLSVVIQITDMDGVPGNDLFEIQTKKLTNLSDITGTGQVVSQQNGTVQFLFIPELGAAPTEPKEYNFGGYVRYFDPYAQAMVTLPLAAVPLTVNPSPNLMLHYFMQRNILGDDALTSPQIEPSVPAELAVMVVNQGYGPAVNMVISSAQPKIIENEKGLAINFEIIGSNFQGQPKALGVTDINFGTIPGLETRIGQWYFTSSLLGKFVSYEAEVVHANSFGNAELSLVKGVKLHELTKSIRAYGTSQDAINDFLVNDIFDVQDAPDIIYFSQGNHTEKVYKATSGSFSAPVTAPAFTNSLMIAASDTGWNYVKLDDPGNGLYELVSVTRSDGQVIPLSNAWLTFVTLPVSRPPVYENKFHFVDNFASLTPVTYTVVWKTRNLDVPEVVKIEGVPQQVTSEQVRELTVTFSKSIDASTFTYEDLNLTFQGGPNIINNSVVITQIDPVTFKIDISKLTTGNGFYNLTVQAANVQDIYGINGLTGKQATWTQFLTVPAVQAFLGIPDGNIASSYDTIQVLFNLTIDESTISPERFIILKDSIPQSGMVTIDSVGVNKKLVYLSGLNDLLTEDGTYQLVVDLPNIKSSEGASGMQQQSVSLTVDNTGPIVLNLEKLNTGSLDGQHVTFIDVEFNENVKGFNISSLQLTWDGEALPLSITQLSNTNLKDWSVGNLGMLTYPEGAYKLIINLSGITDGIGNPGSGTREISWTVNRSAVVTVSNLAINPDRGFSNSDGITSGLSMEVVFNLSEDASQITISQVDLSGEIVLKYVSDVKAGDLSIPVTLLTGGNTGIKITATGVNGGIGTVEKRLFVDQTALVAEWLIKPNQVLNIQIDTIGLTFNEELLTDEELLSAVQVRRNGATVNKAGLSFQQLNDTTYSVSGLRNVSNLSGEYQLTLNLIPLSKYSSGLNGTNSTTVSWTVLSTNQAPVARAGKDTIITAIGEGVLDGSRSYDPDSSQITYHWVAPKGITLSDSLTANPSFTITAADQGKTYTFLLIVSDSTLFSTDAVNVSVNIINQPPILASIGNKTVSAGSVLSFTALANDTDGLGQTLSYSLVGETYGASINAASGEFTWTSAQTQAGSSFNFTIRVTDNGMPALSDEENIQVTVTGEINLSFGLVGHWPLNEGSGAVANDASGNGNHGQLINNPLWSAGVSGTGGIAISGQNKYVSVNTLTWQPKVYSVSWWIKPASLKNYNQLLRSKNGYWAGFLFHTTTDGQAHVGTTSETRLVASAGTVEPFKWQHFVFVFNNGEGKLYKDGVLVASKTGMAASQPWQGLLIGTPDKNNVDGSIDEVRVYDRVLAFEEVTALSDRPEQDPLSVGLVGHWPLNEGSGSMANDASGSGNHGQLINAPAWTFGINSTGGVQINGLSKYITVNTLTWQPKVYSVSWWIKPASLKNYNQILRSKNGYWAGFLFHTTTDGQAHVGTTSETRLVAPAGTVQPYKWQHFVFVFNNGEGKLYKDGALVASKTGMAASQPWQGLLIGTPDKNNVDGSIDEVRVYDRVLAFEEVTTLSDRPEQDPLSVGLVGHWPLNEGSGSMANDISGSGNHGQLVNNPSWTTQGTNNTGAIVVNGQDKYITINTLTWQPKVYSVSWWIKPASLKNYNQILRSKNGYWAGFLFHTTTDGQAHVGTTSETRLVAPAGTVESFKWQHFVFVFNNGEGKLYKDGALVASKTGMAASQPWQGLLIGTPDKNNIDGSIDEVRVYDRVLSLEDVEDILQATGTSGSIAARIDVEPSEISVKKAEFKIYPVPADKKVNLEFSSPLDDEVILNIYDLQGTLISNVYTGEVEANKIYTFELNTESLANGVYLSRLAGKSSVKHQKIVIQK